MVRVLEIIYRDNTSFAFFLCLSILGHLAILIYALPATFPNLKHEPPNEAKLKALTVQITQVYSEYLEPIIATENVIEADTAEIKTVEFDTSEANTDEASSNEVDTAEAEIVEADTKSDYRDESTSGSQFQSILNEKYYSLGELDQIPEPQNAIDIDSLNLLQYAQGGKVELRLWVNELGQVVDVEVINSEMPPGFVESAIKLFKQAQFSSGMVNHNPVKFVSKVVVRYEPH